MLFIRLVMASALFIPTVAQAHDPLPRDEFLKAFGWDFAKTEIVTETIAPGLHVLFGVGGNIAVSTGDDGVLAVDDQFPEMVPKIRNAIEAVGGGDVDFMVNTHWHFDHADGNEVFGPSDTWIIAHENSRAMMLDDHIVDLVVVHYNQKAYAQNMLPDLTYNDRMSVHLNGQHIELIHAGPAHTTGDTAIFFRGSNAVHTGDVFVSAGYPFIDAGNGGSLAGAIQFTAKILEEVNADTLIIPGHGPVTNKAHLKEFNAMLRVTHKRIRDMVADGKTLEEVVAAKPTADYDEKYGDSTMFVDRAYLSAQQEVAH